MSEKLAPQQIKKIFASIGAMLDSTAATPLYRQLKDQIISRMDSGELPEKSRIPTERELTDILGISRRTIRAAFSELTDAGILTATQGRGSFIQNANTIKCPNILVLEEFLPDEFGSRQQHYDWLSAAAKRHNCHITYHYTPDVEHLLKTLQLPPPNVNGILIYRPRKPWTDALSTFHYPTNGQHQHIPVMVVNRHVEGTGLNFVSTDHSASGKTLGNAIVADKHPKTAMIGPVLSMKYMQEVMDGFFETLHLGGCKCPSSHQLLLPLNTRDEHPSLIARFIKKIGTTTPIAVLGSAFTNTVANVFRELPEASEVDPSLLYFLTEEGATTGLPENSKALFYPSYEVAYEGIHLLCQLIRKEKTAPLEVWLSFPDGKIKRTHRTR